jgi:signal transduction histidine kinase
MDLYVVVPLLCVIILGALTSYLDDDRWKAALALGFLLLSCFYPAFLFFLPVVCYDVFLTKYQAGLVLALLPVGLSAEELPVSSLIFIVLISGLSYLTKRRTTALGKLRSEYIALRDSTKEFSILLENKNKELMEKQDYEIRLAMLGERTRIARDIHDGVGHLLSNSILQTGAMLATCRDEAMAERLHVLKETLLSGMETVRDSIHDLHDESVDLYTEIRRLCDNFDFCDISLQYDMDSNPDKKVKYALLSVAKEALSNVMRHSDATQVTVTMTEHPALYQLVVKDNGTKKEQSGEGIGLKNIAQRVEGIGGYVNIGYDGGFSVFVSVPKTNTDLH